jgi:hypothetical protein
MKKQVEEAGRGVAANAISEQTGMPPEMCSAVVKHLDMAEMMQIMKLLGPLV